MAEIDRIGFHDCRVGAASLAVIQGRPSPSLRDCGGTVTTLKAPSGACPALQRSSDQPEAKQRHDAAVPAIRYADRAWSS